MLYRYPISTSSGASIGFQDTLPGGTNYPTKTSEKVSASEEGVEDRTQGSARPTGVRFTVTKGKPAAGKGLSKSLLERAKSIIESFKHDDTFDATINFDSLRGIILELWESARESTQFHQQILGILESAILSIETPNQEQLFVFREAILDLGHDVLTPAHVDVIRTQFVNHGFTPLALLSEIEDEDCGH